MQHRTAEQRRERAELLAMSERAAKELIVRGFEFDLDGGHARIAQGVPGVFQREYAPPLRR